MMTLDRQTMMSVPMMTPPMVGGAGVSTMTAAPAVNMMMIPRCTMKMEKANGGMKMMCVSEDPMAAGMMRNLCAMMNGSMLSCYMITNGMSVAAFNMIMGMCHCEAAKNGVAITCTSGDEKCSEAIKACASCMTTMMENGCTCCVCMNNTPVCCSIPE
jgi:hypothetical protein